MGRFRRQKTTVPPRFLTRDDVRSHLDQLLARVDVESFIIHHPDPLSPLIRVEIVAMDRGPGGDDDGA